MRKAIFGLLAALIIPTVASATVLNVGREVGSGTAPAIGSRWYTTNFVGGYTAGVLISGDGDTDLDLYIYDENGNLVCSSTTSGDDEGCSFTPLWTGSFRIEVRNLGRLYNNFDIIAY